MAGTRRRVFYSGAVLFVSAAVVAACSSVAGTSAAPAGRSGASGDAPVSTADPGSASVGGAGSGGTGGGSAAAHQPTRSVTAQFSTAPTTFDPATASAGDDYTADNLLYITLLARDAGGKLVGNLAGSWTSSSPSDYTFTIRSGATCSDGTAIDASVVANSLKYLASTARGSEAAVFGTDPPTISANTAASTVTIQTAHPYTNLPVAMTMPQSGIVCPAGLADVKGLGAGTVPGAFSGPYTLGAMTPGVRYAFTLRSDFTTWPDFATPLAGRPASVIQFGIGTDPATSANQALAGDLDVARVGGANLKRFAAGIFNRVQTVTAITYVLFNERPGHVFAGNAAARMAVARAINRVTYDQIFSDGVSPVYNTVAPPDYACVIDGSSLIPTSDPAAAAKVLRGVKINMIASNAFGDSGKGAEYIAQMLRNAGAQVALSITDNATWASKLHDAGNPWDLTIKGDIPQLGVVSDSLQRVMGATLEDGGRNEGAADNAAGAQALAAGLATGDQATQCRDFGLAQQTMLQRMDVIPLAGIVGETITPADVTVRAPGGRMNYATIRVTG